MAKLKVIITTVIVLAIVGGAFAFKTKVATFCVRSGILAGNCTTFKKDFRITTDLVAPQYWYYPSWDCRPTACTEDYTGKCTVLIKLTED